MNRKEFDYSASRTSVRLIFLTILFFSLAALGEDFYQLQRDSLYSIPPPSVRTGSAIAVGGAGESFVLLNPSGRVAIWDELGSYRGEFNLNFARSTSPADIAGDGGTGLLVCDPFQDVIAHISRSGAALPPITISTEIRLEPVTFAALRDGRMLLLNRQDGDIWRLERDDKALPLLISPRVRNFDAARLEISPAENRLILLEGGRLRCFRLHGESIPAPKTTVSKPSGIAATDDGVWIVGEGLEFIPFTPSISPTKYPADTLTAWQIYPASDVAVRGEKLLILAADGSSFLRLTCRRISAEHP